MAIKFTHAQFRAFEEPTRRIWISQAASHLCDVFPHYYAALGITSEQLEPLCNDTEIWAGHYDISGERDVLQLCSLAASLGNQFWRDVRFDAFISQTLGNPDLDRSEAVAVLIRNASDWLGALWLRDDLVAFGTRLCAAVRQNVEPDTNSLREVLPGHWRIYDGDTNERLIEWFGRHAPTEWLPAQRLAHCACAMAHGEAWLRDPQFSSLSTLVCGALSPNHLAAELERLYQSLN